MRIVALLKHSLSKIVLMISILDVINISSIKKSLLYVFLIAFINLCI